MAAGCVEVFAMAAMYKLIATDTSEITQVLHTGAFPDLAVHAS